MIANIGSVEDTSPPLKAKHQVGTLVLGLMNVLITRDGSIPPEATAIITGAILPVFVLQQRAVISRQRE